MAPRTKARVVTTGRGPGADVLATAVALAAPGDTLLVAGKGHETGQEVAGTVHSFDDRTVLREVLAALRSPA
jgi:UDP-N-acetylmuramoyl-L-alanyl-D-glutamate--2,6-diaminopimelate ligase